MMHLGRGSASWADGEMHGRQAAGADAHLRQCRRCRDEVAAQADMKQVLASWSQHDEPAPSEDFMARLVQLSTQFPPAGAAPERDETTPGQDSMSVYALSEPQRAPQMDHSFEFPQFNLPGAGAPFWRNSRNGFLVTLAAGAVAGTTVVAAVNYETVVRPAAESISQWSVFSIFEGDRADPDTEPGVGLEPGQD